MTYQDYETFKQSVEAQKKEEEIDKAIVEDGRAKGRIITLKEVEIEFDDPFVKALWTLTFQIPPPPPAPKTKEGSDANR